MVKKFLMCVLVTVCLVTLVGCGEKHYHSYYELISTEPATCLEEGYNVLRCVCGETRTEKIPAVGHFYSVKSDTTTCTNSGIKTSECIRCQDIKTEIIEAQGHSYKKDGYCYKCLEFKYNIKLSESLPVELKYVYIKSNHIYSKFQLTDLTFYIDTYFSDIYLFVKYSGKKTYDENGKFADKTVSCKVILKEEQTGDIVGSTNLIEVGLIVGQSFKDSKEHIVKISDLDTNKEYILQILDRTI